MTVDFADWGVTTDQAQKIFDKTVPLGRKPSGVATSSSSVVGGGGTNIVSGITINQPSFQMLIGFSFPAAAATIPFGRLKFMWTDTNSGFTVDPDWCFLPGGVAALDFGYISGPARADQLTVELDNMDPANILSFSLGISQISHTYLQFRIQEVGQPSVPQFTRAGQNNQMGLLGSVGVSIAASGTVDRLASTWGGPAILSTDNLAATAAVQVRVLDPGVALGGSPLYGTANSGVIAAFTVAGGTFETRQIALPNGPVVIREINTSTTTAIQPTTTLMRMPV